MRWLGAASTVVGFFACWPGSALGTTTKGCEAPREAWAVGHGWAPAAAVATPAEDRVGWLVSLAVAPGAEGSVERDAAAALGRFWAATAGEPSIVILTIDTRPGASLLADSGLLARLADRARAASRNATACAMVVDAQSCFSRDVVRRAFRCSDDDGDSDCDPAGWFKNTLAYFVGLVRTADYARYVVHLDDDVTIGPPRDDPRTSIRVLAPDGESVDARRASGRDWVAAARGLLRDDPTLFSIHPLPFAPLPRGATASQSHGAYAQCEARTVGAMTMCPCPVASVGGGGNGVRSWRSVNGSDCALTIAGYRTDAPHFSCHAFVLDAERFLRALPVAGPARDVETLFEDLGRTSALVPLFVPPSVLGVVKAEVAMAHTACTDEFRLADGTVLCQVDAKRATTARVPVEIDGRHFEAILEGAVDTIDGAVARLLADLAHEGLAAPASNDLDRLRLELARRRSAALAEPLGGLPIE